MSSFGAGHSAAAIAAARERNETRVRIEILIAKGWPTTRIMNELGADYADICEIRDAMAAQ